MVLVLQLKRFSYGGFGSKITKHIDFSPTFTLPLSDDGGGASAKYNLCGVVVHHGHSVHSGHYIAYVKAPNQQWLEMDDNMVTSCSVNKVLAASAYILFYNRLDVPNDLKPKDQTSTLSAVTQDHTSEPPAKLREDVVRVNRPPIRHDYGAKPTRLRHIASWMVRPIKFVRRGTWTWRKNRQVTPLSISTLRQLKPIGLSPSKENVSRPKNSQNGIVRDNPTSHAKNGQNSHHDSSAMRFILNQSKRTREINTEGQWEDVDEETIRKARKIDFTIRKMEAQAKQRNLPSEWDQMLDQGRIKKIKNKKDERTSFDGRNLFQEKLDAKLSSKSKNHSRFDDFP